LKDKKIHSFGVLIIGVEHPLISRPQQFPARSWRFLIQIPKTRSWPKHSFFKSIDYWGRTSLISRPQQFPARSWRFLIQRPFT
jgi:hypothetical protein